jgi:hypothetical protein
VSEALEIRHREYITSRRYRREALRRLRRSGFGAKALEVVHDVDGACCRREPWEATRVGIAKAWRERRTGELMILPASEEELAQRLVERDQERWLAGERP